MGNMLLIGGIFAIMYFLLIRPQQKQAKEQQSMLSALKKGDDVITSGGVLGKVSLVAEKLVTLEISKGVSIRVLKSSIQGKVNVDGELDKKVDEKKTADEPKKVEEK